MLLPLSCKVASWASLYTLLQASWEMPSTAASATWFGWTLCNEMVVLREWFGIGSLLVCLSVWPQFFALEHLAQSALCVCPSDPLFLLTCLENIPPRSIWICTSSVTVISEMFHVPVSPYCCVFPCSFEFFLVRCLTPLGLFPGLSVCFLYSLFSNCMYQSHLLFQLPVFSLHLGPMLLNPNSNHLMSPYIHAL